MTQFNFKIRPVNEFAELFVSYAYREENKKQLDELNICVGYDVDNRLDIIDSKLSSFVKSEINYFKEIEGIGVIAYGFIDDFIDIYTVEDYFKQFEESSYEELFNYLGGSLLGEKLKDNNDEWDNVKNSLSDMMNYIENLEGIDDKCKISILDMYKSPEETKMRLRYILKKFKEVYLEFEEDTLKRVSEETEKYERLYKNDLDKFLSVNKFDIYDGFKNGNVDIYVTYSRNIGSRFNIKDDYAYVSIGYENIELEKYKMIENNLEKFLKLISDKTRQKILFLLADKPWYTQALAKELDITPATVNYHIQNFLFVDILTVNEEDNKVYYILNKEMIDNYISILRAKLKIK